MLEMQGSKRQPQEAVNKVITAAQGKAEGRNFDAGSRKTRGTLADMTEQHPCNCMASHLALDSAPKQTHQAHAICDVGWRDVGAQDLLILAAKCLPQVLHPGLHLHDGTLLCGQHHR